MKRYLGASLLAATIVLSAPQTWAGNPQRTGSAGASELLINPFARTSGWADANLGGVSGLESMYMNVAGLSRLNKTEIIFSNTQWLVGSGIAINNFGLGQRVGSGGVLGINITALDYGEWEVTTEDQPEGNGSTISPASLIIGVAYSQKFTESIYGGVNIKLYNNNINNLSTTGICFDAGIQYLTGARKQWKFGVSLRNVGPGLQYSGDGMSLVLPVPTQGVTYSQTFESRTAQFELPTQLMLGAAYDFQLGEMNRLTLAAAFVSNSFEKDNYNIGVEYGFKSYFMLRLGYRIFDNRFDGLNTTAITGFTGGMSFDIPLKKRSEKTFGVDYSFRATNPFSGIHNIGIRFNL
jgi:hypothetical protein